MATTPNYGWVTPAPTDFVTDLPADFETFADAVDADLAGLLGGTIGQVLTKDSATDHDFSWQDAAGGGSNWTLLNAGGTALTGAATITVSGISGVDKLMIILDNASSANASSLISIRLNTDTGSNYGQWGTFLEGRSTYDATFLAPQGGVSNRILVAGMSNNAASAADGYVLLDGCNSSGVKVLTQGGVASTAGGTANYAFHTGGYYNSASTISSVSAFSSSGNFDTGTMYIYGA